MSGLTKIGGGGSLEIVSGMQCSINVQQTLPLDVEVHHVKLTFCVKCLVEDGVLSMHKRNATHVACYGNMVFMTCVPETHKISRYSGYKVVNQYSRVSHSLDGDDVEVEPVTRVSRCMHWLMMAKKEFQEFVQKGTLIVYVIYIFS